MPSIKNTIAISSAALKGKSDKVELPKARRLVGSSDPIFILYGPNGQHEHVEGSPVGSKVAVNEDASSMSIRDLEWWAGIVAGRETTKVSAVIMELFQDPSQNGALLSARVQKAMKAMAMTRSMGTRRMAYYVKGRGVSLLEEVYGGMRNEKADAANFAEAKVFWPPIIEDPTTSGSASYAWEAAIPKGKIMSLEMTEIQKKLSNERAALFQRYFADGSASDVWVLRATGVSQDNAGDFTAQLAEMDEQLQIKWEFKPRCAFCHRSPPFGDYHGHEQCPMASTLNKFREQAGITPISVAEDNTLCIGWERAEQDVWKEVEELRKKVDALEKRIAKMETTKTTNPSKKRKADGEADPKSKKKQKSEPEASSSAGQGKGKGKKKDKGKGKEA